ncbi:MAG: AEC family transporter [Lachnospiraceae bacterium]|nr:AEC family transporter [Lachnospiraceae bacterium]
MGFLFLLIAIGFVLAKLKVTGDGTVSALSKLETYLFIPAIGMGTFMKQFTVEKLSVTWRLTLGSIAVEAVVIALSFLIVRFLTKDKYLRKIDQYGICFANFGYFGNAIVSALFPDLFTDYLIFTLMLWVGIIVWGAPSLMKTKGEEKGLSLGARLKKLLNPMILLMLLGMIIGISGLQLPAFIYTAVDSLGACMSPIAMLLFGMILAKAQFKTIFRHGSVYLMSGLRLLILPGLFLLAAKLFGFSFEFTLLGVAAMSMPIGLNTIVIPAAYGEVPEEATGMVMLSHLASALTIPFMFWLMAVIGFG